MYAAAAAIGAYLGQWTPPPPHTHAAANQSHKLPHQRFQTNLQTRLKEVDSSFYRQN